ncbi:hypothetical protein DPMN_143192 [Dreissena polymorpha]|uniref:Uncharacterized protein n=1 Tax=Dreissena polymorpha TaxID=45954 RepID=A0A9D4JJG2_DREPO|nr:hypothetical protein DPMN_143192 [Dreissena polymorpha]
MSKRRLHATLIVSTLVSMDFGVPQTIYHVAMEQRMTDFHSQREGENIVDLEVGQGPSINIIFARGMWAG